MRVLIITGGHMDYEFARRFLKTEKFDKIIAADAGLSHCEKLNLVPTDILGDFDSLKTPGLLKKYTGRGVPLREFPARKDYTDTHLALIQAMKDKPGEIVLLAATGTRYDHALANIGLLEGPADAGISCRIIDSHNEIEMLCGKTERYYERRDDLPFFSLLAWKQEVTGIDLAGFSYSLENASLSTGVSLGISNELVEETGLLRMKTGYLLVIRSSD